MSSQANASCPNIVEDDDSLLLAKGARSVTLQYTVHGAVYPKYLCIATDEYHQELEPIAYGGESYTIAVTDVNGNVLFKDTRQPHMDIYTNGCNYTPPPLPVDKSFTKKIDVSAISGGGNFRVFITVIGCNTHPLTSLPGGTVDSAVYAVLTGPAAPAFTFKQTVSPQKLLTWIDPGDVDGSNQPNYPSADQRRAGDPFAGVDLAERPQMFIRGTTTIKPGGRIWLKLLDPPDSAPYVPVATPPVPDNLDSAARIYNADAEHKEVGKSLRATVGPAGDVEVVLEGALHQAGDNYRVIASFDAPDLNDNFPCEAAGNCARSVEVVVWKRLYFENAQMALQGAFLAGDVTGGTDSCSTSNPCQIVVRSRDVDGMHVITAGASLTLMGMGVTVGDPNAPYYESVTVDQDAQGDPAVALQPDGTTYKVRLTGRPIHSYHGDTVSARVALDAVAVGGSAPLVFSVNSAAITQVLRDAFIERVDAPNYWPYVPYVGVMKVFEEFFFARRWYKTATRGAVTIDKPYHRLLVAASRSEVESSCKTELGHAQHIDTPTDGRYRAAFVYERTIIDGSQGSLGFIFPADDFGDPMFPSQCSELVIPGVYKRSSTAMEQLSAAHEVVHTFGVDSSTAGGDGKGHCVFQDYLGSGICLENAQGPPGFSDQQLSAGLALLHYQTAADGTIDSEYLEMRRLHERIP